MARAESFADFVLDHRYFGDIRTVSMVRKHGPQAIGCHLNVISELYVRPSHQLSKAEFMDMAEVHGVENPESLLTFLLQEHVDYVYLADGHIRSRGVDKKVDSRSSKREDWRNNKRGSKKADASPEFQAPSKPLLNGSGVEVSPFSKERPSPSPSPSPSIDNKEEVSQDPIEPPPETDLQKWANDQLVPVEDVSSTQAYMTTGRRPMKRYPHILITVPDLIEIRELYEKSKIPVSEFPRPFRKMVAHIEKETEKGREPWRINAKSGLIGWAYQATMDELKKQNDMQRSEGYLKGQQ